jgi:hypothetical protein
MMGKLNKITKPLAVICVAGSMMFNGVSASYADDTLFPSRAISRSLSDSAINQIIIDIQNDAKIKDPRQRVDARALASTVGWTSFYASLVLLNAYTANGSINTLDYISAAVGSMTGAYSSYYLRGYIARATSHFESSSFAYYAAQAGLGASIVGPALLGSNIANLVYNGIMKEGPFKPKGGNEPPRRKLAASESKPNSNLLFPSIYDGARDPAFQKVLHGYEYNMDVAYLNAASDKFLGDALNVLDDFKRYQNFLFFMNICNGSIQAPLEARCGDVRKDYVDAVNKLVKHFEKLQQVAIEIKKWQNAIVRTYVAQKHLKKYVGNFYIDDNNSKRHYFECTSKGVCEQVYIGPNHTCSVDPSNFKPCPNPYALKPTEKKAEVMKASVDGVNNSHEKHFNRSTVHPRPGMGDHKKMTQSLPVAHR